MTGCSDSSFLESSCSFSLVLGSMEFLIDYFLPSSLVHGSGCTTRNTLRLLFERSSSAVELNTYCLS
jgi:hypothetical protein